MAAVLLIFAVCLLSLSSAEGQDATQNVTGPDILVTDGTRNLTLTCHAGSFPVERYVWITPVPKTTRCETSDNVCTFTPRLEDDNQNVTCVTIDTKGDSIRAMYRVNLNYPPQSSPTINLVSPLREVLRQGDNITCTVAGGKPLVTNVTFQCQHPDLADREDDVSDDERTVSSSITVNTSHATEVNMTCTCSAHWEPERRMYADQTTMSFLLESRPQIMDNSYDPSNPPILAATGRTFYLVAYPTPTPKTIKYQLLQTNTRKEDVPENTFNTEFTGNSTMTHLVNCRVTPQNIPKEKLGQYELSISNRLGDVSLLFNVTSPVIRHKEKKSTGTSIGQTIGIIVGAIAGIVLLVGIIFVIRRKHNAGQKRYHASNNDNHNNETKPPAIIIIIPPTPASQDSQPDMIAADAGDKIKDGQSSTFIEFEAGYTTADQVGKTDCRSTDYNGYAVVGGATSGREDVYHRLNDTNVTPIDSTIYSHLDANSRGAQPEGSANSATPNSIASRPAKHTGTIIGPKGDEYATPKKNAPPETDEM